MTERALRPANLAAAAAVIGGILVVAAPRHAPTVVQLALAAVAAGAGLHAFLYHVPPTGWLSPFRWMSPFTTERAHPRRSAPSAATDPIRATFSGRRQRLGAGPPLPPDTLRLLRGVVSTALGVDPGDRERVAAARRALSLPTWSVLATEPLDGPTWFRTVAPDQRQVAETVHHVLDEIDALLAGAGPIVPRMEQER